MFIIYISSIFALFLIFLTFLKKNISKIEIDTENIDLDHYYEISEKSANLKRPVLLKAAKSCINNMIALNDKLKYLEPLYKKDLISEKYLQNLKNIQEELEIEKCLIKKEASIIKPGYEDLIFNEAKKITNEIKEKKKFLFFDESLYLKKKQMLKQGNSI